MSSNAMHDSELWKRALGPAAGQGPAIERLRTGLDEFRAQVEQLLQSLTSELPGLTVHDITHLDALWRLAGEIAGPDVDLNPAEAFVLGGAILLHDAAHVVAAYPEGLPAIKRTGTWKDIVAQRFEGRQPERHSAEEKEALFWALRSLHARQARSLATISWRHPEDSSPVYLLEDRDLRRNYGDLIGKIAESHHWPIYRVASEFASRHLPSPGFLLPESWAIDALKIALLLRTADAAHIDSLRAPWFLFALQKPSGISADHWRFQSRMSQPTRNEQALMVIASGEPFYAKDRRAWWLAYDTATMIDREIRDANQVLTDYSRATFAAKGVLDIQSPETFAKHVPTEGWLPIDASPKVGNTSHLIGMLGGEALYGKDLSAALREILQNAIDATHALRKLGGISEEEGNIDVVLEPTQDDAYWLHVSDVGIGMGRYVMTEVLLDFGRSLWNSSDLLEELPGLASTGFTPIGHFGIGFFSTFMLGSQVKVVSRRFEQVAGEGVSQWKLEFENGLNDRPMLSEPNAREQLKRSGTRVSVLLTRETLDKLLVPQKVAYIKQFGNGTEHALDYENPLVILACLSRSTARLCPTADVTIRTSLAGENASVAVLANDWRSMPSADLAARMGSSSTPLHPLYDHSNELIGRLGLIDRWSDGKSAVTVNGVANGSILGLTGVCISSGAGTEASRSDAKPKGSLANWTKWAEAFSEGAKADRALASRMHPLLTSLDLPVWTIGGEDATSSEVEEFLESVNEVFLHYGDIEYDSDDDVSRSAFSRMPSVKNLITCPGRSTTNRPDFSYSVGAERIDYEGLFTCMLRKIWGDFLIEEDSYLTLGYADGSEVTRDVDIYERK